MVNVLVLGGSGLLGRYLIRTKPQDVELSATYKSNCVYGVMDTESTHWYNLDIENYSMLSLLVNRVKPDVIIHAAAIGSVDYCEQHYSIAYGVNVRGTENVVRAANEIGAKLTFISSNAVFSGENPPYKERDFRRAVNRYGAMKIQAEDHIMLNSKKWSIVRPILLYGFPYPGGRENWATTVVKRLRTGFPIKVVNDTVTQPTYAADAASTIWQLLNKTGEWNVADHTYHGNLYDFTLKVADVFGLPKDLIEPVPSSHFQGLAARPIDTSYDTHKLFSIGNITRFNGLHSMKEEENEHISSYVY